MKRQVTVAEYRRCMNAGACPRIGSADARPDTPVVGVNWHAYTPDENHPRYNAMLESLKNIFDSFKQNNIVEFDYETKLYLGKL